MKRFLLILLTFLTLAVEMPAASRKAISKPVTTQEVVRTGGSVRTAQQEAELRDWIKGIQKLAQDAQLDAERAESDATQSRSELDLAAKSLGEANAKADTLQKAINTQTDAYNKTLAQNKEFEKKIVEQARHINTLKNFIALEASLAVVLLLLWLKIPSLTPPWGLVATCAAPVVVFGLVKLII